MFLAHIQSNISDSFILRRYLVQNFQSCCSKAIETHYYSNGLSTKSYFSVSFIRLMHCLCMLNNNSDTRPLRLNVITSLYELGRITYAFLHYLESENIFKNKPMSQLQFGSKYHKSICQSLIYLNLFVITKYFISQLLANIILTIQAN